jgi:DNA-binding CsgD family transcriptional regulator
LQQIFHLLLENKSQEEIARELHISTRMVARYSQRIEKGMVRFKGKRHIQLCF